MHRCAVGLCLFLSAALLTSSAQTPPTRIMPLGDSITFGAGAAGGYRNKLHQLLTAAGFNVDFVGTQTGNGVASLPDSDHQGHSGWRIDQLDANILGWLGAIDQPDVVLLHIGTNDFGQDFNTSTAINRLDALILKIAQARPYAHILVTNLMVRNEPANTKIVNEFNPFVQGVVSAHAAAGRKVEFLDMRAAVPLSDMPDQLHPNQAGYDKMADAWAPAVQALITPLGDGYPPALAVATGGGNRLSVAVQFSKPIADASAIPSNFSISGGVTVSGAVLDASKRVVTLTTSLQAADTSYTVTVNGVQDRTPGALTIAPNSTINFAASRPRGYLANAPESACYSLVYSLDLPSAANYLTGTVAYTVDNSATVGAFDRVGYFLELQEAGGELRYVWASMDAFTTDATRIGIPTLASGAQFQQPVTNLIVDTNVPGLLSVTNAPGNLEFWPYNYSTANGAAVPGASGSTYDFGDTNSLSGAYGSMQVHSTSAGQTVFAWNNWGGSGGNGDLGIGNQSTGHPDWTFANNAGNYVIKTLHVLVRTLNDASPPVATGAMASWGRTQVVVRFNEPLLPSSVTAAQFSLSGGAPVLGARLSADGRVVTLSTATLPSPLPQLSIQGVRDASAGNPIAPGAALNIEEHSLPPEIAANIGPSAGAYKLVASTDIPTRGNYNTAAFPYSYDDRGATGTFARVAYYLETQRTGFPSQYAWVSFNTHTPLLSRLLIPTAANGNIFQQSVTDLEVLSNVAGVSTGTGFTGNLEIWPNDYSAANGAAVPGASATTYDFGDTRSASGAHGSFQFHNTSAAQSVICLSNFGADGNLMGLGIGNQPTGNPDWTFAANTAQYARRRLHILVLPGPAIGLPAEVTANVPSSAGYILACSLNIPAVGNLTSGAGFTNYSFDQRAALPPFGRIAYYLELQKTGDPAPRFVWTAMDAFTTNPLQVGVPNTASGSFFQRLVNNLEVVSNATAANSDPAAIVTGFFPTGGNIEFWPSNYNATNAINVPNASASLYDWGDGGAGTGAGYGSMQVHSHLNSQVLFAINRWGTAGNTTNPLDLGIGNNPSAGSAGTGGTQGLDYTFAGNAASYDVRRVLHVLVKPGNGDVAGPVATLALPSATRQRLVVTFNEPVSDPSANPANFTLSGSVTVTSATLLASQREIALETSLMAASTPYTLSLTGVRDRSAAGNLIAPGATVNFTSPASAEPVLANIPEAAGYQLVHKLAVPTAANYQTAGPAYAVDESKFPQMQLLPFDRIAYCLELVQGGTQRWVYVSTDAFTPLITRVGVPTVASGANFQRILNNVNVYSSANTTITNGLGLAACNIEFWPSNYSAGNAIAIPGASATLYDWGDTATAGNYGSMQIHNHGVGQTLFAFNRWGGTGGTVDLGIGNSPAPVNNGLDWTFAQNAAAYTTRNLFVLVRPGPITATGPSIWQHPCGKTVAAGSSLRLLVRATGALSFQWRRDGVDIPGATRAWLDLTAINPYQAGQYDVVVTGAGGGTTTSLGAPVVVTYTPAPNGTLALPGGAAADLLFHGYPGIAHNILRSTNLVSWAVMQAVVAAPDGSIPFQDPAPPFPRAYYRVEPAPP